MDEVISTNNNNGDETSTKPSCTIFCSKVKSFNGDAVSPAFLNSQRALIVSDTRSLVASSNRIVQLEVEFPANPVKHFTKIEGIPTPITIEQLCETEIPNQLKSEIQSIVASSKYQRIGAIDSRGAFEIFSNEASQLKSLYSVGANSYGSKTESGWSGLSFDPVAIQNVAVARYFQRQVHIFDTDRLATTFHLTNNPTQIAYVQHPSSQQSLLAVTEHNQLNIYDPRLAPRDAIVQRFQPTADVLYTITTDGQNVAVGGASRSVHVYDCRRWTNLGNWSSCLKYEITNAHFSSKYPSAIYLGGLDSEILAGDWNGSGTTDHFSGLRVDSRWLGISKLKGKETLFGLTGSGSVYWVHDVDRLYTPPPPKSKKHTLNNKEKPSKKEKQQQKQQNKKVKTDSTTTESTEESTTTTKEQQNIENEKVNQ
ncbi:hypothetical protein PPL_09853 [Heterostelium album PN500]|uniref:WD40 repeat-containing protein n=1 Tax=Heterostelium pallidum (strain ATCC 26659 / Pp 5 / PN500) TaxID=670386 RepID=D3BP90_HETP5|nr:hypothetical protein PPL_09853 [Heterostelium album PN500]EFA77100.1 hypothetical protein PPL_09853 [Heterostelium album PN500]|eukprot:XP_020429229.1 hypothetical protein PPL_09853 [Heterostelium album PN500]